MRLIAGASCQQQNGRIIERKKGCRGRSFNMQMRRHLEFKIVPPPPPPERLVVRVAVPGSGNGTISEPGDDGAPIRMPTIRSLSERIRSSKKESVF
ncbi:hypothetical protein NPIL_548001 [Nephila pilipes]|uniref:Uncharacterized protein n=1 Tax=Nephila pilipes TaxID=299642 RepID=A0A8X6PT65_NEPPI|nr:hypothetical protein NPIL_548001 [Nephila pilipes]